MEALRDMWQQFRKMPGWGQGAVGMLTVLVVLGVLGAALESDSDKRKGKTETATEEASREGKRAQRKAPPARKTRPAPAPPKRVRFDASAVVDQEIVNQGSPLAATRVKIVTRDTRRQAEACARAIQQPNGGICWAFKTRRAVRAGSLCWTHMAVKEDDGSVSVTGGDPEIHELEKCP